MFLLSCFRHVSCSFCHAAPPAVPHPFLFIHGLIHSSEHVISRIFVRSQHRTSEGYMQLVRPDAGIIQRTAHPVKILNDALHFRLINLSSDLYPPLSQTVQRYCMIHPVAGLRLMTLPSLTAPSVTPYRLSHPVCCLDPCCLQMTSTAPVSGKYSPGNH